jgi:hypothetical protein
VQIVPPSGQADMQKMIDAGMGDVPLTRRALNRRAQARLTCRVCSTPRHAAKAAVLKPPSRHNPLEGRSRLE